MNKKINKTINARPTISVVSISYNQEKYIAKTLESFVSQVGDFDLEIIIADDKSTDKTPLIISDYAKKYSSIRPILRKKNIGIQKNLKDALTHATGEYIALCEGDDYWTDTGKLQKQLSFLQKHSDVSLVFHPVKVTYEDGHADEIFPQGKKESFFTIQNLLKANFIQTNSVLYRRLETYDDIPTDILPMDWYLHLVHARPGKIGFINDVMSVYRRHKGGVWWDVHGDITKIWRNQGLNHLRLYRRMSELFGSDPSYDKIIRTHSIKMFDNIINLDKAAQLQLEVVAEFPELRDDFVKHLYARYGTAAKEARDLRVERDTINHQLNLTAQRAAQIESENRQIKESLIWKARNRIARVMGKEEV